MRDPSNGDELRTGSMAGQPLAHEQLLDVLYDDLRALAAAHMKRERADHTLQPTALVHEAFVRMVQQSQVEIRNRAHFLGLAALAMRRVLVDHARSKNARKHGGGKRVETLDELHAVRWEDPLEVLALDEALSRLAAEHPRQARVVELRFFGGLSLEEAAEVLDVSRDTVKLDWRFARAWLNHELGGGDASKSGRHAT